MENGTDKNEGKLSWFAFYPGDWLRDAALQSCSLEAKGLWIDMLCLMHQAEPYGHLVLAGEPMSMGTLARLCHTHTNRVTPLVTHLVTRGVLCRDTRGVLYSKRLVRDYEKRLIYKQNGQLGGNPSLKNRLTPRLTLITRDVDVNRSPYPTSGALAQAPTTGAKTAPGNGTGRQGTRAAGTNPRARGDNPRAGGESQAARKIAAEKELARKQMEKLHDNPPEHMVYYPPTDGPVTVSVREAIARDVAARKRAEALTEAAAKGNIGAVQIIPGEST